MAGWASALIRRESMMSRTQVEFSRPSFASPKIDLARVVTIDFETYYDTTYTLSKLSTSEYIRAPQFKAHMMGIKVGKKKTRVVPHEKIRQALSEIDWGTHSLLCHNTQFDGFILSHHYGVVPCFYYDTLSMARGLHNNDIGASLDEVAEYYGVGNKITGVLEKTQGVVDLKGQLYKDTAVYCGMDVDLTISIFEKMVQQMPAPELSLVDLTTRMFCDPVLKVDIARVEKELAREIARREELFFGIVDITQYPEKELLKTKQERLLEGKDRAMLMVKRVIGSNERFAELLRAEGAKPPLKVSPAWIKKRPEDRCDEDKWAYAFAKDDQEFIELPDRVEEWSVDLNLNKKDDITKLAARQERLRNLVDCRIAVRSTTNITRAERFLTAGAGGMSLPVGYAYAKAHTLRWAGNNKMNMQNLTRGGELRQSIIAPAGHQICVADSGQIEARVAAWLWGQDDLLEAFRVADAYEHAQAKLPEAQRMMPSGDNRDAYCRFADSIYGFEVTKQNKMERFVGKVCIAEDELVLTDKGLVPIQSITMKHMLWDGVEWVEHAGLIDQGIQEVMLYDGLVATKDHEVFTQDGRIIPLWQAASEMASLQTTGHRGQNIRFCDSLVVADTPRKRLSVRQGSMFPVGDQLEQPTSRQDNVIPQERVEPSKNKVRVYDIANAGPRRRFTVSGKLVLNCVLGLGFSMGAQKLQATLAKGALGGPPVFFELEMCQRIVQTYRRKNHRIAAGWKISQKIIEDMAVGCTGTWQCLSWEKEKIWLPNGMCLKYPGLRKAVNEENGWDEWSYQAKNIRKKLYGGLLTENIVQCLARLIVAEQMLAINTKYRVVMMTHDEVVALPKTRQAAACFAFMMKAMTTAPAWCSDLPLNAEGGYAANYSK